MNSNRGNLNYISLKKWKKMFSILTNLHTTWTKRATFFDKWHSFMFQTKHFHWFSRHSCLGNCHIWKVNIREKTVTLHGWTQMVVRQFSLWVFLFPISSVIFLLTFSKSQVTWQWDFILGLQKVSQCWKLNLERTCHLGKWLSKSTRPV